MITLPNTDTDLSALALPQAQKKTANNQLGQDEFLRLMTTQLQSQDPLQPMDNGQFIGQMAQFSTVQGISGMSKSLGALAESLSASTALQASTMVGRSVLIEGDTGQLTEDQSLKGGVDLPAPVNNGFVRIFDVSGQLVRELPLGPRGQGVATFEWDGTLPDGSTADPGTYLIRAGFMNGETEEALPTYTNSQVTSVTLNGGGTSAEVTTADGQRVRLSQIKAIM